MSAVLHSIIIPHRNRHDHLRQCLQSIEWAQHTCGAGTLAHEVVVVDNGSAEPPGVSRWGFARLVVDERPMPVVNKCALLNRGIDEARGEILTFLDADAIVGPLWLHGAARLLADDRPTLVAYRVRYLPQGQSVTSPEVWMALFTAAAYNSRQRAWEGYGTPDRSPREPPEYCTGPVFGNSQFSIRRDVLGDLRWDEAYVGRGWEDLDMLWRLWRRIGSAAYRGFIERDDPRYCLYHAKHPYSADWRNGPCTSANLCRWTALTAEGRPQ